jgi:hypothetical protein
LIRCDIDVELEDTADDGVFDVNADDGASKLIIRKYFILNKRNKAWKNLEHEQ